MSDLSSGLAGGITASPSASYGKDVAVFECLHGKAPELVGKDMANPIPMLNAAIMMLEHLQEYEVANRIRKAIERLANQNIRTQDLGGRSKGSEITQAIIDNL